MLVDRVDTTLPFTNTVWSVLPMKGLYLSVGRKSGLEIIPRVNWVLQVTVVYDLVTWVCFVDCTVLLIIWAQVSKHEMHPARISDEHTFNCASSNAPLNLPRNQVVWRPVHTCSEIASRPMYPLIRRNLPDAKGRDGETPDEVSGPVWESATET